MSFGMRPIVRLKPITKWASERSVKANIEMLNPVFRVWFGSAAATAEAAAFGQGSFTPVSLRTAEYQ